MLPGNRFFLIASLLTACLLAALFPTAASADEKAAPLRRIAIMPLVNLKPDKETDWLGKGTAETLTTNLMKVSGLLLVEQAQLATVLYQQDRQIADFADRKTAVKVGKIVGAERVLIGSYAKEGQSVLFNVRMVDVETGIVLHAASVRGEWDKIFDLMTQLATAVIDSFDKKVVIVDSRPAAGEAPKGERIILSEEEAKKLKDSGTTNREAYEAMSRGCSEKDPNNAVPWYTRAIELDPSYSWAYNRRGLVYMNKGDIERAIKDYDKAIELSPKYAKAFYNRGIAYYLRGDFDKAIKDYDNAIELDPKYVWAYNNRGTAYERKKDFGRAIKDYDKAIELDPNYADAYGGRSIAYYYMRQYDKAWEDVRACKRLGGTVKAKFLEDLRKASGKNE